MADIKTLGIANTICYCLLCGHISNKYSHWYQVQYRYLSVLRRWNFCTKKCWGVFWDANLPSKPCYAKAQPLCSWSRSSGRNRVCIKRRHLIKEICQGQGKHFIAELKYNWFDLYVYTVTTFYPLCIWLTWFSFFFFLMFLASSTRRSINCLFY